MNGVRPGDQPGAWQMASHAVVEGALAQRVRRLGLGDIHQQLGREMALEATITLIPCGEKLSDHGKCVRSRLSFCPRNFLTPPKSGIVVWQHANKKQLTALRGQWHGKCN